MTPSKKSNARFTTFSLKALSDQIRYQCLYNSKVIIVNFGFLSKVTRIFILLENNKSELNQNLSQFRIKGYRCESA